MLSEVPECSAGSRSQVVTILRRDSLGSEDRLAELDRSLAVLEMKESDQGDWCHGVFGRL